MRWYVADLHVHTALSPCAEPSMTPARILAVASRRGLDILAICDHNSAGNVHAVWNAARRAAAAAAGPREVGTQVAGVVAGEREAGRPVAGGTAALPAAGGPPPVVVPGIEITTREEVHVLGLFAEPAAAVAVGEMVLSTLPERARRRSADRPPVFADPTLLADEGLFAGRVPLDEQLLFDAEGRTIGTESRPLDAASSLSLSAAVALIREHLGLAVAAHVDRRAFSVLGQLGLLPEEPCFDAAELSVAGRERGRAEEYRGLGLTLICGSDSHFPEDVGRGRALLRLAEPSFAEIALALRQSAGRRCDLG
jgi:hypothetical protein